MQSTLERELNVLETVVNASDMEPALGKEDWVCPGVSGRFESSFQFWYAVWLGLLFSNPLKMGLSSLRRLPTRVYGAAIAAQAALTFGSNRRKSAAGGTVIVYGPF